MTVALQAIDTFLAVRTDRWLELLRDLVGMRSVFEQEHAVVGYVARYIQNLGGDVERVDHAPEHLARLPGTQPPISDVDGRCSVVTRVKGSGGGRSLVLNAHLDIVPEGDRAKWSRDPFGAEIDPDRGMLYGRGAMDDKAGVAISLGVLETLMTMPIRLRGDVVFHYVLENETTGNGSLLCLSAGYGGDAAAIIDGTRLDRLINEHAGQLQFELALTGRPASVAVSHLGQNAAELMARLVVVLRDAVHALNAGRISRWTCFPSPFQLVVQRIQSEGAQTTVPDLARAQCYMTFPPPFTLARARDLVESEIRAFESQFNVDAPVSIFWSGLATEPVRSEAPEFERALIDSARRVGVDGVQPGPSTGTSDLRHFVQAGIPCVLFGPGRGYNPHRSDEQYFVSDLTKVIAIYLELLTSWCGLADPASSAS